MSQWADDLLAGETLSTPDGQTETVIGTTSVAEPQGVLVYNFTVADDHTYFVEGFGDSAGSGTTGSFAPLDAVWVHNSCLRSAMQAAGEKFGPGEEAAHIVPQNIASRSAEVQTSINRARAVLNRYGLLNRAEKGFKAMPGHLGTHTDAFLGLLGTRLMDAERKGGVFGVLRELTVLKQQILGFAP